ncbi:MAG: hypothetical protein WBD20_20320 [Pirellulaceae bacterium]
MSATNLSDLLPIPDGVSDPHAYQVFGLDGGEQDANKIKLAVAQVYAKLKAAKQASDPSVWKQAAKLAEKSKAILADPSRRAELDARFGIVNFASSQPPTGAPPTGTPPTGLPPTGLPPAPPTGLPPAAATPAADPLAGMLPPTDPMANPMASPMALAGANPMQPVAMAPAAPAYVPPAAAPTQAPAGPITQHPVANTASPAVTQPPKFKVKKNTKRRKKSGVGKLLFILGLCGLAAASAGMGVFMYLGRDIPITKDGKLLAGGRNNDGTPSAAAPAERNQQRRKADPVMGKLAGEVEPPRTATGLPINKFSPPQDSPATNSPDSSTDGMPDATMTMPGENADDSGNDMTTGEDMPEMSPDMTSTPEPEMTPTQTTMPEVNPDSALPVSPGTTTGPVQLTDAQITENDTEIQKVKKLIQDANWSVMQPAAEKVTERILSETQKAEADALYNLADLASFYRGGLQRGLGTLKATQDFEVTDGFRVLVVEVSTSSLTIKYNGRNKTYSIDEIPLRLAEKIASFAMDLNKPDVIAAKAAFQAISPLSNEGHRKESIEWLELVDSDMPDVDAKAVAAQIKQLF